MHLSDRLGKNDQDYELKWNIKVAPPINFMPHWFQQGQQRSYLLSLIGGEGLFNVLQVQDFEDLGVVHIHPQSPLQFVLSRERDVCARSCGCTNRTCFWRTAESQLLSVAADQQGSTLITHIPRSFPLLTSGCLRAVDSLSCSW